MGNDGEWNRERDSGLNELLYLLVNYADDLKGLHLADVRMCSRPFAAM